MRKWMLTMVVGIGMVVVALSRTPTAQDLCFGP